MTRRGQREDKDRTRRGRGEGKESTRRERGEDEERSRVQEPVDTEGIRASRPGEDHSVRSGIRAHDDVDVEAIDSSGNEIKAEYIEYNNKTKILKTNGKTK